MAYDLIKISALPAATPDESQEIVVGVGDLAKRINYGDVKNDMVGTSPTYTTDTEPYLMRQTANIGVVGKCALNKLVGGSLGWNQLIPQITATASQNGVNYASTGNGTWTITGALESGQTQGWYNLNYTANVQKILSGHVYYARDCDAEMRLQFVGNVVLATFEAEKIVKVTLGASDTSTWVRFQTLTHATLNKTLTPQVLDLTAMFGSTIADYIYSLESATAGAGVAWLSKYIDLSTYHAYDAGSIQSVQATAHVTTGFNQWDETWEMGEIYASTGEEASSTTTWRTKSYIPVIGGTQYYLHCAGHSGSGSRPRFYDGSKNYIGYTPKTGDAKFGTIFTVPDNCAYMRFCPFVSEIPTGSPITLNISKPTGTPKNGDYVPYSGHTYPLGSDALRGIPQLVSNKLQFDGDIKTPDGTIKRKYGSVDMGTLTWTLNTSYNAFVATLSDKGSNSICGRYPRVLVWGDFLNTDKSYWSAGTTVYVKDSAYSTAAAFKTAMSGVYLVYELATPTTESSTSYQKIQTIDADGTESFTTSTPVPVGHETQTPDNILAALGWLGE